jgi:Mrp family chromosome partitioning ATPase
MVDLTSEMGQLWTSLGPWVPGRARVVQFVAAKKGEGTSTIAREFARLAVQRARRAVWLVDLDLADSPQHSAILGDAKRFGGLGPETTASPDGSTFLSVQPPTHGPDGRPWPDARYVAARQVGGRQFWVTRFRRELLRPGQQPHIIPSEAYWTALRQHADVVVIDAPSADRSNTALAVAPFADTTVIVVTADEGDVRRTTALRDGISQAGGHCAGIVFNRAQVETPSFIKAILPGA